MHKKQKHISTVSCRDDKKLKWSTVQSLSITGLKAVYSIAEKWSKRQTNKQTSWVEWTWVPTKRAIAEDGQTVGEQWERGHIRLIECKWGKEKRWGRPVCWECQQLCQTGEDAIEPGLGSTRHERKCFCKQASKWWWLALVVLGLLLLLLSHANYVPS